MKCVSWINECGSKYDKGSSQSVSGGGRGTGFPDVMWRLVQSRASFSVVLEARGF